MEVSAARAIQQKLRKDGNVNVVVGCISPPCSKSQMPFDLLRIVEGPRREISRVCTVLPDRSVIGLGCLFKADAT